jgi:hypothetical protein
MLKDFLLVRLISFALSTLALTWRIRLEDRAGIGGRSEPVIWVLWHNRLLVIPIIYHRFFKHRKSVTLVSRSKDGELLARCIERFGGIPVRGSSSRGGAAALMELHEAIAGGHDAYITPDGPRGPRYKLSPGVIWLAQKSKAPVMPVQIEYSSCWRLGRWDGFVIPKPFSRITVTLREFHPVRETDSEAAFAQECERLQGEMMRGMKLH